MPTPPELGNVSRKIRVSEIRHKVNPKKFRRPDCDVGVSGEVSIYLKSKDQSAQGDRASGWFCGRMEHPINISRAIVSYDNFLEQTPKDLTQSIYAFVVVEFSFVKELRYQR